VSRSSSQVECKIGVDWGGRGGLGGLGETNERRSKSINTFDRESASAAGTSRIVMCRRRVSEKGVNGLKGLN
jgi:hypothetical protein